MSHPELTELGPNQKMLAPVDPVNVNTFQNSLLGLLLPPIQDNFFYFSPSVENSIHKNSLKMEIKKYGQEIRFPVPKYVKRCCVFAGHSKLKPFQSSATLFLAWIFLNLRANFDHKIITSPKLLITIMKKNYCNLNKKIRGDTNYL
jgi:hypothetical protein